MEMHFSEIICYVIGLTTFEFPTINQNELVIRQFFVANVNDAKLIQMNVRRRTEKKQIWLDDKKLAWKEAWQQVWRTEKKLIWVPSKVSI